MAEMSSMTCGHPDELQQPETFSYRIAKFFLTYYSMICHIPISHLDYSDKRKAIDNDQHLNGDEQIELKLGFKSATTHRICLKRYLVSKLVATIYIYSLVKICTIVYYQYIYWSSLILADQLNLRINSDGLSTNSSWPSSEAHAKKVFLINQRSQLYEDLKSTWVQLKSIGCPHIHFGFNGNLGYLLLIVLCSMLYIFPLLFSTKLFNSDRMTFLVLIFNRKLEIYRTKRMTDRNLRRALNSSRNFALTQATLALPNDTNIHEWESQTSRAKFDANIKKISMQSGLKVAIGEHRKINEMLVRWRHSGELMPIDRDYAWVEKMSRICSTVYVTVLIYATIAYALIFCIPIMYKLKLELDILDAIVFGDILFLVTITVFSSSFYLTLLLTIINCKLNHMSWLSKQMSQDLTMLQNFNEFMLLQKELSSTKQEQMVTRMNEVLVLVILRYKNFREDFRSIKRLFATVAHIATIMILIFAIVARLHLSYMLEFYRGTVYLVFITFIPMVDSLLIPMCQMHHAGLKLSRHLWSLLAHSRDLNWRLRTSEAKEDSPIYYEHTLRMYDKELHDPEKLGNQFAINTILGSVTYPNLVELHYWAGLLIMSTFFETESWRKMLGSRIEDPLNLYGGLH